MRPPTRAQRALQQVERMNKEARELETLRSQRARLASALRALHDEQNGPPMEHPRHRASWQAAMDEALKILEEVGG